MFLSRVVGWLAVEMNNANERKQRNEIRTCIIYWTAKTEKEREWFFLKGRFSPCFLNWQFWWVKKAAFFVFPLSFFYMSFVESCLYISHRFPYVIIGLAGRSMKHNEDTTFYLPHHQHSSFLTHIENRAITSPFFNIKRALKAGHVLRFPFVFIITLTYFSLCFLSFFDTVISYIHK